MKGAKIILHARSPTFGAAKLKGFTVSRRLGHHGCITSLSAVSVEVDSWLMSEDSTLSLSTPVSVSDEVSVLAASPLLGLCSASAPRASSSFTSASVIH